MHEEGGLLGDMEAEIQGQLESIIYTSGEDGYTVARLKVKGFRDLVTVTGSLFPVNAGEILKLRGNWHNHPQYGPQFKVISCESVVPATREGIEKYLASGLIKGTGSVIAKRIVEKFGDETLNIIENSISRLKEVEGIGEKRLRMIERAWAEHKEIKEVMIFLQGHGVSASYAARIFKRYGRESIKIVRENPYRLAVDVSGIGFVTADRIAEGMGVAKDSPMRAEAGILYVLNSLSVEGHVYYPYERLMEECRQVLGIEMENILKAFGSIALQKKIVIEAISDGEIKQNNKAVYLPKFHKAETYIAETLKERIGRGNIVPPGSPRLPEHFLSGRQIEAVRESIKHRVIVITGGPGTGKTTVIKSIIETFEKSGQRVLLAAPTGRAAKRMTEATGHEAKTIHRLLEYNPQEGRFRRNEADPLSADVIVIDETSMVDCMLMHHLLRAVPSGAGLVLVGDVDQLPSVGAGNILRDVIDSGIVPTVRLDEIFRQSKESLIVVNAHRINKGDMPELGYDRDRPQDFYFFEIEEPERILEKIISLCKDKIPERYGLDPMRDIQVISAMHKGIVGVSNLNVELQRALNPLSGGLTRAGMVYKKGDKVMQVVNNYDRDVYNGDIGIIAHINTEQQEITVDFDGRPVTYDYKDMEEIVPAYAISVHKSQGSEYPAVIMPVHTQHYMLLQRNLLYTAVTRGKKLVIIVGTKKAFSIAVKNDRPQKRFTYLKGRLMREAI